ncbi:MAG TPA: hypothetical protein VE219_07030, partial [Candidatus Sulfotelmatobacter sp.]|nr:hypothetical protein [Candidatus Sulfotelmatobacter sp.]
MSVQLVRALGVGGLAGCAVLGVVLAWRGGDRGERAGERQARSRLVLRLLALAGSALLLRAAFSLVQD